MAKRQKTEFIGPPKPKKSQIPESLKKLVEEQAQHLVDTVLKPEYVKPPPEGNDFTYLVDIYIKWHRSYFYFCVKHRCPSPNCITEFFDDKIARIEHVGDSKFNLAYIRHTGKWWETYTNLDLDECLQAVAGSITFF